MKILTLDGGGCLAIGQAAILSKVTKLSKFHLIAGTSAGALVGALIALDTPPDKFTSFFVDYSTKIFAGHKWRKYNPFTPRYNDKQLVIALKELFPQKLGDVKIPLLVTTADLNNRRMKVFYSGDPDDANLPMWEVLRMAVAAETYFLPWKGMADGGIYANNPCMVGVAGAVHRLGAVLEKIELCSIGTGTTISNTAVGTTKRWSLVRWGLYLINTFMEGGASSMHEYFVARLPIKKIVRIQFERGAGWTMDDATVVQKALVAWGPKITKAIRKVNNF